MLSLRPLETSIITSMRTYLILFASSAFISALMKFPRLLPILLRIVSQMNSIGISCISTHIGNQWIFADDAWKPGYHFWTERDVLFKNQGPLEMTLLTSFTEPSFEMKNPFPMGIVVHGLETFQSFLRDRSTYFEENDLPHGLEIMEHAHGLHKHL